MHTPQDTAPRLHLGINTCFAVKRWPEPRDWARIVREDLGLDHVQLSLDLLPVGYERDAVYSYARRARVAAADFDLEIHSLFTGLAAYSSALLLSDCADDRAAAFRWYEEMIHVSAEAGARGLGGHLGALSVAAAGDPDRAGELVREEQQLMRRLADTAAADGLDHLQFENLAVAREYGHAIEEAHAFEEALAGTAVPWRLCLDLGHPGALQEGGRSADPLNWLSERWVNTPVVQLQQSPPGADHHGPFTDATNAVGSVDRDAVLDGLAGWEGDVYLFFEIIHAHEHPDEAVLAELRQSVDFWRTATDGASASG